MHHHSLFATLPLMSASLSAVNHLTIYEHIASQQRFSGGV